MAYVNKLALSVTLLLCSASAVQAIRFDFMDHDVTSATAAPAGSAVVDTSQPVLAASSLPANAAGSIAPAPSAVVAATGSGAVSSSQSVLSSTPAIAAGSIAPAPLAVVVPTGSSTVSSSQPLSAPSSAPAADGVSARSTASEAEINATQTADAMAWGAGALALAACWFMADKNQKFRANVTKPVKKSIENLLKKLREKTSYQIATVGAVALAVVVWYREALSKFVRGKGESPLPETPAAATPVLPPAPAADLVAPVLPVGPGLYGTPVPA